MKARYISVWKLRGANQLVAQADSVEITRTDDPRFTASVTADPALKFERICG